LNSWVVVVGRRRLGLLDFRSSSGGGGGSVGERKGTTLQDKSPNSWSTTTSWTSKLRRRRGKAGEFIHQEEEEGNSRFPFSSLSVKL